MKTLYDIKYVAFLDILGFSKYVSDEDNVDKVDNLFKFANRFCFLFNSSPELNVYASFFSDSIVLYSDDLGMILTAIYIAEGYVKKELGLLFRGGICKGKICFSEGMIFGPALIDAYELEKNAGYSRILFDSSATVDFSGNDIVAFTDYDGRICYNNYSMCIHSVSIFAPDGVHYPEGNPENLMIESFANEKLKLIQTIEKYARTSVAEKYIWRIRAFNYTCRFLHDRPETIEMFGKLHHVISDEFRNSIMECQINEAELIDMVSESRKVLGSASNEDA